MSLQKISRSTIEKMHRSGELKKVGTVKLVSGEQLSGAKFRDYLLDKAKKYGTVTSFTEAVKKDTAKSQWRQREKFVQTFKARPNSANSVVGDKDKPPVSHGFLGLGKSREKPKPIKRDIIRAGRVNLQGEYEEDAISSRPGMAGSQPKNISIGVGSRLEQAKNARTSALDSGANAIGIGGGGQGFKTIGSITNKK